MTNSRTTSNSRLLSTFATCASSFCGVFLLVSMIVGCGQKSDRVTVRGKVSYRGEGLTSGSVTFFPTTGRPVNAPLSADSHYTAELRPGEYVVTISVSEPLPAGYKEGDPIPSPKIVLPPEYTTRAKSKLTATVREGEPQTTDFPLE